MSTSPYSLDLRKRVIQYIESGKSQASAAKVFSLNISTVSRWYCRYRREGHYHPRVRLGAKRRVDLEALTKYVSSNPEATLKDLAKRFKVSIWGIYYWLKKLGFSYKKKPIPMWRPAKKEETNIKKP